MGARIDDLERRLRDASLGKCEWFTVLQEIADWVGGSKGMLLGMPSSGAYRHAVQFGHRPEAIERYDRHFNQFDPRMPFSKCTPVYECQLGQQYVANADIEKTEYFDAISRFGDVCDSVHGIIADDEELGRLSISVQRGFSEDFFTHTEADRLSAILPQLDMALRDSIRAQRMAGESQFVGTCAYALVDQGLHADFLPDCDLANLGAAAKEVRITNGGKLAFADERIAPAMTTAIDHAIEGRRSRFRLGELHASLSPMPQAISWMAQKGCALLALFPRRNADRRKAELFGAAFELTAREIDVLAALMANPDPRAVSTRLSMQYETLRWHVKNICLKTGHPSREAMLIAAVSGDLSA